MTRSLKALLLAGVAAIGLGIMPGIAAAGHDRDGRGQGVHRDSRGQGVRGGVRDGVQRGRDGGRIEVRRSHGGGRDRRARRGHAKVKRHKVAPRRGHDAPRHARTHDDDDRLWPFLVIGAVGLTAAILATQSRAEALPAAQPVSYVQPPAPAYPPPAYSQVVAPAYTPVAAPAYSSAAAPQGSASSCLMTREYQTRITVGGRLVDAYGQACMQPDGAWFHGPAQAVPDY